MSILRKMEPFKGNEYTFRGENSVKMVLAGLHTEVQDGYSVMLHQKHN